MRIILFFLLISFSAFGQNQDWRNGLYIFDEFLTTPSTSGGGQIYAVTSSGSVSIHESKSTTDFGLCQISTSTSTTGRAAAVTSNKAIRLGSGPVSFEVKIDSLNRLCDATNSYALLVGLFQSQSAATQSSGVFFLYDSIGVSTGSASSDRWQTVVCDGSTRNYFETSEDVTQTATILRADIDSDGTGVEFYINGTSARSETAAGPVCAGCQMGFGVFIIKSAGTTACWTLVDYVELEYITNK